MLRIAGLSGAELPIPADVAELLPNGRALKQHLSRLIGIPRFRIRLLIGGVPLNDILPLNCYLHPPLKLPLDLQLVVLGGFQDTDAEQRGQLTLAAARGYVVTVESGSFLKSISTCLSRFKPTKEQTLSFLSSTPPPFFKGSTPQQWCRSGFCSGRKIRT